MTHAEKLQQLFEAALKDSSDLHKPPTRAFPTPLCVTKVAASQTTHSPEPAPAPAPAQVMEIPALPVANPRLSNPVSAETGARPVGQHQRKTGKHRLRVWIALGVFLALTGGGFCWFIQ